MSNRNGRSGWQRARRRRHKARRFEQHRPELAIEQFDKMAGIDQRTSHRQQAARRQRLAECGCRWTDAAD
jgi:hypothetical protein